MSFECVEAVLDKSETHMAERLVLICLAERADENRQCYPSRKDISHRARLNEQVVSRVLERLEEGGDIVRLMRIGTSSKFIVATGLTSEQVDKCVRKAWGKSLREVVATNKAVAEKLGQSKGNEATLLAGVKGSDPSTGSTTPLLAGVPDPSSGSRSEPSITINNHQYQEPAAPEVVPSPEEEAKKRVGEALFNHIARQGDQATQQLTHYQLSPAEVESAQAGVEKGIKARVTKVTEELFTTLTAAVNRAGLALTGQDKRSQLLKIIARDLDPEALADVVEAHARQKKAGWAACTNYSLNEAVQAWDIGMAAEPTGTRQTLKEFHAEILRQDAENKARFAKVTQPV